MKHTRIRYDLLFKWLGRRKLTQDSVGEYVQYLREKGLVNVSINTHIRVITLIDIYERDFNKDLHLLKKVSYFPKEKRIPVILSQNEIEKILFSRVTYTKRFGMEGSEIDINRNLALWVIAATGCRLDECLTLRKCDIVLGDDGYIKIERKPGFEVKNKIGRKVPIPNSVIIKLQIHLEKKNPEELAFTSAAGNKISATSMEEDWHKRLRLAGITKAPRIHDLRASYIMAHLRSKTPLPEVSKLVGHKDIKTTMGYTDFNDEDLFEAAKNHPMFAKSLTPLQKIYRLRSWLEKIREELEHDGDFSPPELTPLNGKGYSFKVRLKNRIVF
jgi:integrase